LPTVGGHRSEGAQGRKAHDGGDNAEQDLGNSLDEGKYRPARGFTAAARIRIKTANNRPEEFRLSTNASTTVDRDQVQRNSVTDCSFPGPV